MYLHRIAEKRLAEIGKQFAAIAIFGPRQVGKSTMVQMTIPKEFNMVTLDDLGERTLAEGNPDAFLNAHQWPLFIDEIQKSPNLFDAIKIRVDDKKLDWMKNDRPVELMYILSGSNQFELKNKVYDSLAGRIYPMHLYSLSYPEKKQVPFKAFTPDVNVLLKRERDCPLKPLSRKDVFQLVFEGGHPEIVTRKTDRNAYWSTYLETYIDKDVQKAILSKNLTLFHSFLRLLALRTGQELNKTGISNNLGISTKTIDEWLSILELSGIIYLLHPYMANASKRIIKAPKVYFLDTGFCAWLCGWPDGDMLEQSAMAGAFYETYVVTEIIKSLEGEGINSKDVLYYYRDIDQKEIDILYIDKGSITPIEIKKSVFPVKPAKNFNVLSKYGLPINTGLIIDTASSMHPVNDKAWIYPIHLLGA